MVKFKMEAEKMKKQVKIISLLLGIIMLAGVMCGCGGKDVVSTGKKYTYWVPMPTATGQTQTSFNDLLMYQEMIKATGVDVEFIHPSAGSTGSEAFQILLASADFPDMMEYNWKGYTGGPDQAIADGVIISLNDYMEDYAPNYYDYMEGKKAEENGFRYKAQSISMEGNYYGFKRLNIGNIKGFSGLYVRKDLLDKWGLDIPTTIDEWENVFKVAKENGIERPLTCDEALFSIRGQEIFNAAWEVGKAFYLDNGKVKFGPFEKNYKKYLEKMADWTKKGYVDIDYITNESINVEGAMTNGTSIAAIGSVGAGMGKLLAAMEEKDPNYSLAACPYPVIKKGSTPWIQYIDDDASEHSIAISAQCGLENEDRYKEAFKFCDYLYSEEGMILKCFGVEGDTFTREKDKDGVEHFVYTDRIYDHEKIGAHSVEAALYYFMRPANSPGINQHPDYLAGYYPYESQKEAIKVWNKYADVAKARVLPALTFTSEEASERATILAAARDNLDAAISNIILGKASIDSYDDAIKAAKKGGYDRLLEITQAAYDRYIKVIDESK